MWKTSRRMNTFENPNLYMLSVVHIKRSSTFCLSHFQSLMLIAVLWVFKTLRGVLFLKSSFFFFFLHFTSPPALAKTVSSSCIVVTSCTHRWGWLKRWGHSRKTKPSTLLTGFCWSPAGEGPPRTAACCCLSGAFFLAERPVGELLRCEQKRTDTSLKERKRDASAQTRNYTGSFPPWNKELLLSAAPCWKRKTTLGHKGQKNNIKYNIALLFVDDERFM